MELPAVILSKPRVVRQAGMTLVEMMIAMVIGLLVVGGVGAVFLSTSSSVKALDQLASLQESGRFAISSLSADIGMANAQYCSSSGGKASLPSGNPNILLDNLRAPKVYANGALLLGALNDVTTPWGGAYPAAPSMAYAIPEYLSMRGYDCDANNCTPLDPNTMVPGIPSQGTAIGNRVVGSSVLTVRYLDSSQGWSIGSPGGSSITGGFGGSVTSITLAPLANEPPVSTFGASSLAMLSDCSLSQVFAVTGQGSGNLVPVAPPTVNFNTPNAMTGSKALRLFDFNNAYNTVTYFLQVVDAGNGNGETTGALMRRFNGTNEELVRGIERLNFRYGVMQNNGLVGFMTANQVDTAPPANCPWIQPEDSVTGATNPYGCLWRAVMSVEIDLLASGQVPLRQLTPQELFYSYGALNTPTAPTGHAIQPVADQGFPDRLLRREFTALVATRNYNP